jgi:4-alpha-glucanotransferase
LDYWWSQKVTQAHSILDRRRAGILLHITSLPNTIGNGDLGHEAYRFVDFLVNCKISVWQTLPINPTHGDGSPYQCLSAHAGNPLLIDLQGLLEIGLLDDTDARPGESTPAAQRLGCLDRAFERFNVIDSPLRADYRVFVEQQKGWLDDYALFIALRQEFASRSWQHWPVPIRERQAFALDAARVRLEASILRVKFEQFVFFRQWQALRRYANSRGIILFGDIPIFVAGDSADVWARQSEFDLNDDGQPRVVAGVPPDYFSATGQRWGNPHYRWDRMVTNGFSWWLARFHGQLGLYDWVRIDHFRGFEAYWEIPVNSDTAMEGHWVQAPGEALLYALFESVNGGRLPLVAENLGIITPEVEALRERFDIPGMLILQFAFDGGSGNPYLPHNHTPNNVVYTGTHDNDTTASWFEDLSDVQREHIYRYLGRPAVSMPDALISSALASVARLAIIPMQDLLSLGKGHRMNTPGTTLGNWSWRFSWDQVSDEAVTKLADDIVLYGRQPL